MNPDIIIPTWNSAKTLRECLKSIKREMPNSRIIIVDRYSIDDTIKIAKEFDCEIYYNDVSLGAARQLGISRVKTKWFAFVDSDIVLCEDWLKKMRAFIAEGVGAVQSVALFFEYSKEEYLNYLKQERFKKGVFKVSTERTYTWATLLRTDVVRDIDIGKENVQEDVVIGRYMIDRGYDWLIVPVFVRHLHVGKVSSRARWNGAITKRTGYAKPVDILLKGFYWSFKGGVKLSFVMKTLDPLLYRIWVQVNMVIGYLFPERFEVWDRGVE